jgi:UDP-2,3-diacylglucosamine hydrolase
VTILFVSDLHLDPARPDIIDQFIGFLRTDAARAEALYILGDMFEAWVGDDDPEPEKRRALAALKALKTAGGPRCHFMRGNRDFLTGQVFAGRAGVQILPEPHAVDLFGRRALLLHGDTLCTDDHDYQAFRRMVRDPAWQQSFLAQPLPHRIAMAAQARDASRRHTGSARAEIMDVNEGAVIEAFRAAGVDLMIHGHTHRPGVHTHEVDGRTATRIVLGDWYEHGSVLRWDESGYRLETLPR